MDFNWPSILVAILGSSVVAALIKYFGDKRQQSVDFKNQFRKELITKRLDALELVSILLERLRIATQVNPKNIQDYSHLELNESEKRSGFSFHSLIVNETELELTISEAKNILEKELWISYDTYLQVKHLKDILMECKQATSTELYGIRKYRSIEERRIRLQIELSKAQRSIEDFDNFIDEKIRRAQERLDDYTGHE